MGYCYPGSLPGISSSVHIGNEPDDTCFTAFLPSCLLSWWPQGHLPNAWLVLEFLPWCLLLGKTKMIAGISARSFYGLIQETPTLSHFFPKVEFSATRSGSQTKASEVTKTWALARNASQNTTALFQMLIYSSHTSKLRRSLAPKQTVWLKLPAAPDKVGQQSCLCHLC